MEEGRVVAGLWDLPASYPLLLAALAMALLAGALVFLNFNNRANRAFAAFLVFRALQILAAGSRDAALAVGAVEDAAFWARLMPYFAIPTAFVVLYFVSIFPKPRGWFGRSPSAALALLLGAVALELLYVSDHGLWTGPTPLANNGPLALILGLIYLPYAVVVLLLAHDTTVARPGPARRSTLVVGLGFTLNAVFDGTTALLSAAQFGVFANPNVSAVAQANLLMTALGLGLVAAAVAWLARFAARSDDAEVKGGLHRFLLAIPLPVASAVLFVLAPWDALRFLLVGLWRLALPVLVTYALVRHELFDIDIKIKVAIKQSTVAAFFIGLFFIVSEAAQNYFASNLALGPYLGIAAAGLLLFAISPLQALGERVASAALPGVKPVVELDRSERAQVYLEQVRFSWADGALDRRERQLLDNLRERLGLSVEEALRLEHQVTTVELAQPSAGTGGAPPDAAGRS